MTRNEMKQFQEDVALAVQGIADDYGIAISQNRGSFHAHGCKLNITLESPESKNVAWDHHAEMLGFKIADFGREFTTAGRTFRISGVAPKSWKRPILADDVRTGKTFKFQTFNVLAALERA